MPLTDGGREGVGEDLYRVVPTKATRTRRKRATCECSKLCKPSGVINSFSCLMRVMVVHWRWGRSLRRAELFDAQVTWTNPEKNELDMKEGVEWVLKVFKKGPSLSQLQTQWPQGLLQFHAEQVENWKSPTPKQFPRFQCSVYLGTLLEDGRFAFLMHKEHFDLRNLIEHNMELRKGKDGGPFSKEEAELMMYQVALGVDWLHRRDIVHRDLKASNVLIKERKSGYPQWLCFVADYECSIGVVGTGFFRAPEILQACKERKISQIPEVFSRAADVYAFGMICYEILRGKLPFEGHPVYDYDVVLNGERPMVPEYVEDWTREHYNLK